MSRCGIIAQMEWPRIFFHEFFLSQSLEHGFYEPNLLPWHGVRPSSPQGSLSMFLYGHLLTWACHDLPNHSHRMVPILVLLFKMCEVLL